MTGGGAIKKFDVSWKPWKDTPPANGGIPVRTSGTNGPGKDISHQVRPAEYAGPSVGPW